MVENDQEPHVGNHVVVSVDRLTTWLTTSVDQLFNSSSECVSIVFCFVFCILFPASFAVMCTIPNTPMWVDFFAKWREFPEVWKMKSEEFKDRNRKRNAWGQLLECYRQIEPNANMDSLKKRINNIKTCYRRELKKVERSVKSGAGAEEEYVPNLWYFDHLEFLQDQETQETGISTMDMDQDEPAEDQEGNDELTSMSPHYSGPAQKRKKSNVQHNMMEERNDLLMNTSLIRSIGYSVDLQSRQAVGKLGNQEEVTTKDEASVFAESWATSYRKLSPTQQIFAKKAIEDVLVLGQLNSLTFNSVRTNQYSETR